MKRLIILFALIAAPLPASAEGSLGQQVSAILSEAGPGTRWGVVVADADGKEIVSIDPEGRYVPASNTKLFTTAAAFWKLGGIDTPDRGSGALVWPFPWTDKKGGVEVMLVGRGDARLSAADDCKINCLSELANAIAAKTRNVSKVIGDDTHFPDERWSPGMSWNNIPTEDGTGISALSVDNNEVQIKVAAVKVGVPPTVTAPAYFQIRNDIETTLSGPTSLGMDRLPGSRTIRLSGSIAVTSPPKILHAGIDDPADYAAWQLTRMLRQRGVKVARSQSSEHRPLSPNDDPEWRALNSATLLEVPPPPPTKWKFELAPPPLIEDLVTINKVSQNLHAELLLRRLGRIEGSGSLADGQKVITAMLTQAGLKSAQYAFSDGSGMSTYNRVAPRGVVTLLRWTQAQPWGAQFTATLPIGGIDGTLKNRFKGTTLEGRITAKTGTLNATNALAGFLTTRSGKMLTFAAYANDVPDGVRATSIMDKALVFIAESN